MRRDWNNGIMEWWNGGRRAAANGWNQLSRMFQWLEQVESNVPVVGKNRAHFSTHWKSHNSHTPTLPHSHTSSRKAGLTLVEVMMAIVILGIGAGTLMVATARCMAVATKAKHYSNAHRLMMRVGAENPLTRSELDAGTKSGSFDNGYTWEREITESEEEDREGLYTIRTRVRWSARGNQSFEESITYRYVPPDDDGFTSSESRAARSPQPRRRTR